ncbi:hypothetical protein I3843_06G001100 [Carya illinoinensis]|nr:hypothetical protein I3843_06G001100 [Carya illinoinensis]
MALATSVNVVLGSLAFAIFWVLVVFPVVPFLLIGTTAGSLLGAMLMVIFRIITPNQAYVAIDLPILSLLFGTMLVGVYLESADMFKYLGKMLSWKILTKFVLKIERQHNLPTHPFLLALASSANIGISFRNFLVGILPATLLGVVANGVILICLYWRLLSIPKDEEDAAIEVVVEDDLNSHYLSPATMSRFTSLSSQEWKYRMEAINVQIPPNIIGNMGHVETIRNRLTFSENDIHSVHNDMLESTRNSNASKESSEGKEDLTLRWKRKLWKSCVYLVTMGMLIAFNMGLNMSWTAITTALALMVLDFRDARSCLEKVSYLLLIFFCGMFIIVDGFNKTSIPSNLWDLMEPYAQIDRVCGIVGLDIIILILSNLASIIPIVNPRNHLKLN